MDITFDPAKSARNEAERGFGFHAAADFDFAAALIWIDDRFDYPETRYSALGRSRDASMLWCFRKPKRVSGSSVFGRPTSAR
jgi:uncharacterized DUF497 family protein